VEVKIDNNNPSKVNIGYKGGNIVRSIEQRNNRIRISISPAYRLERMVLEDPLRLVLDIIVANPNRQQKLNIAEFYTSCGKLNSADKLYVELNRDYPNDGEILYKWALLLEQRGSNRLKAIVAKIPKISTYYSMGQSILARVYGKKAPSTPPAEKTTPQEKPKPIEPPKPVQEIPPAPESDQTVLPESLIATPPLQQDVQETPLPMQKKESTLSFFEKNPLLIVFFVLLLLLIIIIFIFIHSGKKKPKPIVSVPPEIRKDSASLDTETLCRMVSRLLINGWTNKQIAKELKLPEEEVERLVKLSHQGNYI
jgi:tetratricopeptide (TPR) repeat protein